MGNSPIYKTPIIDIVESTPSSEEERKLVESWDFLVKKSVKIIKKISKYQSCEAVIKLAIEDPRTENEDLAFKAVDKCAHKLHRIYNFAIELEDLFFKTIAFLSADKAYKTLVENKALVFTLMSSFPLVFRFDEEKLVHPTMQNDFTYFRRVISKSERLRSKTKIDQETADQMCFFFALPMPMMKALNDVIKKSKVLNKSNLIECFEILANSCIAKLYTKDDRQSDYFGSLMVGSIVFLDNLNEKGVFDKNSRVKIKSGIHCLVEGNQETLLNSIRFSTCHLNDDSTSSKIKKMLVL